MINHQVLQNFNRAYFHCQYINHEDQQILGFCLNAYCKQVSQFCFLCSKESHKSHPDDLIIFKNISKILEDAKAIMRRNQQENENLNFLWVDCENIQKNINPKGYEEFKKKKKKFRYKLQIIQTFTIKADQYLDRCIQAIKKEEFQFVRKQIRIFKKIKLYQNDLNKTKKVKILFEKLSKYKTSLNQNYEFLLCKYNSNIGQQQLLVKQNNIRATNKVEVKQNFFRYDVKFYLSQGKELMKQQYYQQALESFDDAIRLNPQCYKAHLKKGFVINFNNRAHFIQIEVIQGCFRQLQYGSSPRIKGYYFFYQKRQLYNFINGCALLELNFNSEAIEFLNEALKLDPRNSKIYFYEGLALKKQNLFDEAIEQFTIANQIKPSSQYSIQISEFLYQFQNILIIICKFQIHYNKAQEYLLIAKQINPQIDQDIQNTGILLMNVNQYEKSLICFDRAILSNPKESKHYFHKGNALFYLNKYQESLRYYDEAIKLFDQNENYFLNKGITLSKLNMDREAIYSFDQAIKINPQIPKYYSLKSFSLCKLGYLFEATACLDNAIKLDQNNYQYYLQKGDVLHKSNKAIEALQCYLQALKLKPQSNQQKILKGNSLAEIKEQVQAYERYDISIELNPQNISLTIRETKQQTINFNLIQQNTQTWQRFLPQ